MAADRRIRVLYVTWGPASDRLYGAERSIIELVSRLDRSCFDPCGAIVEAEGATARALRDQGVPVLMTGLRPFMWRQPRTWTSFAKALYRATALARRSTPDIVHANHLNCSQYGGIIARRLGIPSVLHLRDLPTAHSYWSHLGFLHSVIVANSSFSASGWTAMRSAQCRLRVIHNGIDVSRFRPSSSSSSGDFVVGMVGRISR